MTLTATRIDLANMTAAEIATASTSITAHGLWNPAATNGNHVLDVSYVHTADGVWRVLRQCDNDVATLLTIEDARADYAKRLRTMGYKPAAPSYTVVALDRFSRVGCYSTPEQFEKLISDERSSRLCPSW